MAYSRKYTKGKRGKLNMLKRKARYYKRARDTFAAIPNRVRLSYREARQRVRRKIKNMTTKPLAPVKPVRNDGGGRT